MTAKSQSPLDDAIDKVQSAKEAARAPGASALDKADLKLREQEAVAEKLKAGRPEKTQPAPTTVEGKLDKALKDSFPGSDPVSFVQAAPVKKGDRSLSTVPDTKKKDS
jgi:hypothetical protein